MDVLPDASFARVTTHIPGGNTLLSSRALTVTTVRTGMTLQQDAAAFLRLHLPPFFSEGAIYCPRRLRKNGLIGQLGLVIPCGENGDNCICYVNSDELSNQRANEVEDGDFIWCLHAPPEEIQSGEVLSVVTHSDTSVEEVVGQDVSSLETPQGLIGAAHYCSRE